MDNRWDNDHASELKDELDRLVYLGRLLGQDESLLQAGGGGLSLKRREKDVLGREVEVLWVKGSGVPLAEVTRSTLAPLRLEEVRLLRSRASMTEEELRDFLARSRLDPQAPPPSVHAPLHAFLPHACIVHTLDFATQALTDTTQKDAFVREALGDEILYLGYVRPGFSLARAVATLKKAESARGLVLGKHGLVTWGKTPRACYQSLHQLIRRAEEYLRKRRSTKDPMGRRRYPPAEPARRTQTAERILPILRGLLSRRERVILECDGSEGALRYAGSELAKRRHARGMAAPEYILHCGRLPLHVDADLTELSNEACRAALVQAIEAFETEYRTSFEKHRKGSGMRDPGPRVLILPGVGLVAAGRDRSAAATALRCYRHVIRVMEAAETLDQFRFLEEASAFEFEYWSSEPEGQATAPKELSGRVALVTGAGQGIGRAIAERLVEAGGHVALTDLDEEAAVQAARQIGEKFGDPSRTMGLRADATSEAETSRAFARTVEAYGGLDILACNAGFVQPAPIATTPLESWRKHLDVNLTGYFLAVREATRIMKAQGIGGAILLNASKAAFAAPFENAAYASSKAAVAHLARNLAVELGPAGIRVNYVNADFIDTPMGAKMIEERARQKGISQAAQIEEYRRRNLLRVGPIPAESVAEAVLFLVSDRSRYTTGSLLTVDGGLPDAMPR
jgi:rhamnulose-1-phosphate aldolase/alcohol dehydrogenase